MSFFYQQPISTAKLFSIPLHTLIPTSEHAAWQETLDSLATVTSMFALVVCQDAESTQVLFASHNAPPAYSCGQSVAQDAYGACIIATQQGLWLADAQQDLAWAATSDAQQGVIACLGEPLLNVDKSCFGALLLLDTQARSIADAQCQLLKQFRALLEARLSRYMYTEQLSFFSKFPETNPNIVLQVNQQGSLEYFNPAAWRWLKDFGFAGDVEALQRLFPPDFNPLECAIENQSNFEKTVSYNNYHYLFKAHRFPNTQDFFITIIDISERVRLEKSKQDIERMMIHDLKAPLSHIIHLAEYLLMTQPPLPAAITQEIETIHQAGQDMHALIVHSLDLYKMEQGTYQVQLDAVDVLRVFKEVIRTLHLNDKPQLDLSLQLNGQSITLNQGGCTFMVAGEYRLFKMAYLNLIKNAYEAAPDKLRLHIDINGDSQAFSIVLTNNAVIPSALRPIFFDKYSTADKPSGTGLGTYSAWLAVRTLGGDIAFDTSDERGETRLITRFQQSEQANTLIHH